jgi:hypothetical protein
MRYKILIISALLFIACGKEIEFDKLSGSWKTENVIDQSGQNATDKMTFYSKDSICVEIFTNRKLVEKYIGNYKLNKKTNAITIQYKNQPAFDFEIIQLTDKELAFKNFKNNAINKCVRY